MKNLVFIFLFVLTATGAMGQRKYSPQRTLQETYAKTYNMSLFRGVDGIYLDMENDPQALSAIPYFNILNWLQGRVPGLQVYHYRGVPIPFIRNSPATIFVDEMRMDASVLNMIPIADIGLIKVMRAPFAGVMNAPGGAIAIYTKKGEADEEEEG